MTTKSTAPLAAAKKKIHSQIAATQRQADSAKKIAKVAKLGLRKAKQKFKDAKRVAKKFRKNVKTLKAELAALTVKRPVRRPVKKPAAKRVRPVAVVPAAFEPVTAPVDSLPPAGSTPPAQ